MHLESAQIHVFTQVLIWPVGALDFLCFWIPQAGFPLEEALGGERAEAYRVVVGAAG